MKILFLDTIYPSILEDKGFFDLPEKGDSYKDLARTLDDQKFSSGSMYLPGLVALSNQIEVVYVNARKLQLLWDGPLDSGRCSPKYSWKYWQLISRIPLLGNLLHDRSKKARIVMNQIKILAPSVVYCLNVNFLSERLIKQIKEMGVAVVGQIASPLIQDRSNTLGRPELVHLGFLWHSITHNEKVSTRQVGPRGQEM
jgi:hypothetical protein